METSQNKRVVITGMGMLTPVGHTVDETWQSLLKGTIGIRPIDRFDISDYKASVAGIIEDFDPTLYIDKKEARRMDRYCQLALAATKEAFENSGLEPESYGAEKIGVVFGTGIGGLITLEVEKEKLINKGPRGVSPLFIPTMISNIATGRIAMIYQIKGDNYTVSTACASGTHAIGEAFRKIKHGYLDACVCGGSEATLTPIAIAGFGNMTALSKSDDPKKASLPFDARRDGFVLGEGAGMLVLESLERAKARGAKIYGEIVGYGATSDAYHITSPAPDGKGPGEAMKLAMKEAGITPESVDYINAHGTGTPLNDKYETLAIKYALGEKRAYEVAINSTKSMTGHLLGAAGAVEAIVTSLSIHEGIVHQTVGLEESDPDCDLDYVAEGNRSMNIRYALSNSLGFGGHNATLCFKKFEDEYEN